MKKGYFIVWVWVLAAYFPWSVNAQSAFSNQTWNFGFHGGILFPGPGELNVDPGGDYAIDPGFVFGTEIDGYVAPKLSVGFKYIFSSTSLSDFDESASYHTLAATFKARFNAGEKLQIRPGIAFGYNRGVYDDYDGSNGMDVGFILQGAYSMGNGKAILGEFGFISQPVGGNDDYDIAFPPIMYFTIGYEFGN